MGAKRDVEVERVLRVTAERRRPDLVARLPAVPIQTGCRDLGGVRGVAAVMTWIQGDDEPGERLQRQADEEPGRAGRCPVAVEGAANNSSASRVATRRPGVGLTASLWRRGQPRPDARGTYSVGAVSPDAPPARALDQEAVPARRQLHLAVRPLSEPPSSSTLGRRASGSRTRAAARCPRPRPDPRCRAGGQTGSHRRVPVRRGPSMTPRGYPPRGRTTPGAEGRPFADERLGRTGCRDHGDRGQEKTARAAWPSAVGRLTAPPSSDPHLRKGYAPRCHRPLRGHRRHGPTVLECRLLSTSTRIR